MCVRAFLRVCVNVCVYVSACVHGVRASFCAFCLFLRRMCVCACV